MADLDSLAKMDNLASQLAEQGPDADCGFDGDGEAIDQLFVRSRSTSCAHTEWAGDKHVPTSVSGGQWLEGKEMQHGTSTPGCNVGSS